MVEYETFNLCYVGSNPTGLIVIIIYLHIYSHLLFSLTYNCARESSLFFIINKILHDL